MGVYLAVALGGAAGSISRFGIDQAIERRSVALLYAVGSVLVGLVAVYAGMAVGRVL